MNTSIKNINTTVFWLTISVLIFSVSRTGFAASGTFSPSGHKLVCFQVESVASVLNLTPELLLRKLGFSDLSDQGDLRLTRTIKLTWGTSYNYQQYYAGLPVIGGRVVVYVGTENTQAALSNSLAEWQENTSPDYSYSFAEAIEISRNQLKCTSLRAEPTVVRAVFPVAGEAVFGYRVTIPARLPLGDWEVFVRGDNGQVLHLEDRLLRLDGAGLIFNPDPITVTGDPTLQDQDDRAEAIPEEAYQDVILADISGVNDEFVLTGQWVDTEPTANRARMEGPEFLFDREDDRFEEVMAYYHLTQQALYLAGLGFLDVVPQPIAVAVNGVEEDLSFFSPFTGILTTGSGGVDDAEDADVLIHEYTHSVLQNILNDWRGGETALMTEGVCDYFAGDYSLAINPDFQPYQLYNWDGHNEFWAGRILNSNLRYPEIGELESHLAGQLWSSLLMEVRQSVADRELWNTIVLEHLSLLADSSTIPDAIKSLLFFDLTQAQGAFRDAIVQAAETRAVLPLGLYSPVLTHQPLPDTEDLDEDRRVDVRIFSEFGLDLNRTWLIYGWEGMAADTINLLRDEVEADLFSAQIPGPGAETDVEYYFLATDTFGVFTTLPGGAPLVSYRFHAGLDRTPPIILNVDSLSHTVFRRGEVILSSRVRDNLGLGRVEAIQFDGNRNQQEVTELRPVEGNPESYSGRLTWEMGDDEIIFYQIRAVDASQRRNTSLSSMFSLALRRDVALDDFELESPRWTLNGWQRTETSGRFGSWGLADRTQDGPDARDVTANLDESWDLSEFRRFRLRYWETHDFDRRSGEYGVLEISDDEGENWLEISRLTGVQGWWVRREVNLDEFTGREFDPFRIRWRTVTPEGAEPQTGWHIDEISITTDNIVKVSDHSSAFPGQPQLTNLFPNPTNSRISADYLNLPEGSVVLYNLQGQVIRQLALTAPDGHFSLNLEHLPAGYYLLEAAAGTHSIRKKVVLIK